MSDKKIIKSSDMPQELQEQIFEQVDLIAKDTSKSEKVVASELKKYLDQHHGKVWHVIVGNDFASYISHEAGRFIYFYVGDRAYMLFKTP